MQTPVRLADIAEIQPFSPWLKGSASQPQFALSLPAFRRDAFNAILADITGLPQMVSVTGPRRVGKTTLLKQCIQQIMADAADPAAQAQRIAYFSMDDPALDLPGVDKDRFFNELVAAAAASASEGLPAYLFLDEIQRFPRWELYLKKFYDLKLPVKFVVSGSASSPIFKKSRESLLGRIVDHHVLPFSFREWFSLSGERLYDDRWGALRSIAAWTRAMGHNILAALERPPQMIQLLQQNSELFEVAPSMVMEFLFDGGFPEVWSLPTLEAKQTYLYQNQVERVIFEDLLIAAEFRKPEMLRRFYLGLLKDPGREVNIAKLAQTLELDRRTIESYFPLLEATDLVWRLHKHTSTKATPKAGNFKTYLVDLAVRNAVMKLDQARMAEDATLMGHYAENVTANHLRRWPGLVELGYWRKGEDEIDFLVDLGHSMVAVEVKYRNEVREKDILKAARLAKELKCEACIIVAKTPLPQDTLAKLQAQAPLPLAVAPLAAFLMLF